MSAPRALGYTRRLLAAVANILRRFARGRARCALGPRSGRALALLDLHPHGRGGHFGPWLRWFAGELSSRFDDVLVVTPDPRLTRALFTGGQSPPNLSFHRVPRRLRRRLDLDALRELEGVRDRNLAAFFMWGYDLVDHVQLDAPASVPWGALAGVSWLKRTDGAGASGLEARLQVLFRSSPSFRVFVQPDAYLNASVERAIVVPDVENVALPPTPGPRAARIRVHAAGRFCVGAFGMISGYRCLNELLPLAQAQPEIRFVVAGKIAEQTVEAGLRPLLRDGAVPNLLVLPGFIPTEEELNEAIATVDAVFIDGRNYPVQSGVVCKAVHAGRCIITPRSNSWTQDFVEQYGAGVVYASRTEPIAAACARWKASGGEARSRAASAAVRDPAAVRACFDRLARELQQGWESSTT